jgi:two-component system, NarL family, nitrate/nitrite response regulator NarL
MTVDRETQIAVLVADTQPLFLDGASRAIHLDAGLRLVAGLDGGSSVLPAIRRLSPDVAVVDERLGSVRILGALAQHGLRTLVVVMTADVQPDTMFGAVAAGARGYLSKRVSGDTLCDAVRRIAAGESVLCVEAQTVVTSEIRLRYQRDSRLLTQRELDVLVLIAQGQGYREIGRRLHLAPTTVKTYAARAYERLGARDRIGAVVEAMRRGILD